MGNNNDDQKPPETSSGIHLNVGGSVTVGGDIVQGSKTVTIVGSTPAEPAHEPASKTPAEEEEATHVKEAELLNELDPTAPIMQTAEQTYQNVTQIQQLQTQQLSPLLLEPQDGRFVSPAVLRVVHRDFLRRAREEGDQEQLVVDLLAFMQTASQTGTVIDNEEERNSAQGILDYWTTILYRLGQDNFPQTLADFDNQLAPELGEYQCPYLGLSAFGEGEQNKFFGRRRLIAEAIQLLQEKGVLVMTGPSGSGKSSLLVAGIMPKLKEGVLPGSDSWLYLPVVVPGKTALLNLAQLVQKEEEILSLVEELKANPAEFLPRLNDKAGDQIALVVIDEFEEVFTQSEDEAEQKAVLEIVTQLSDPQTKHKLLVAFHSDYEKLLDKYPTLKRNFGEATIRVTPPTSAELREVVIKPAEAIGLKFDDDLIDRLLQDVSGEKTVLPLLQFTLLRLWDQREKNRITWEAYHKLGGGRRSLVNTATTFYQNLSAEEKQMARRVLLAFVHSPDGSNLELVRVERQDLWKVGGNQERIEALLHKLQKERLLRFTAGETAATDQFDLVHIALTQDWQQMVEWLDQLRFDQRQRLRLRSSAAQWLARGRDPNVLRRGELLQESLGYKDLSQIEKEYLEASVKAEQERLEAEKAEAERRVRDAEKLAQEAQKRAEVEAKRQEEQYKAYRRAVFLSACLGIAIFIMFVAFATAYQQYNTANYQAQVATTSEAGAVVARSTAEAALLNSQLAATQVSQRAAEAISAQATAEFALQEAQRSAAEARAAEAIALTAQAVAEQNALEAQQQSQLVKSGQLSTLAYSLRQEQPDVSTLLALEAIRLGDTVEARSVLLAILQEMSRQLTLQRQWEFAGHTDRVFSGDINPARDMIASGGYDNRVILWSAETGLPLADPLVGHTNWVRRVAFNFNGQILASGGYDNKVILWNIAEIKATGRPVRYATLQGHSDAVSGLAFFNNPTMSDQYVVTASHDQTLVIWDISEPTRPVRVSTPQGGHQGKVYDVAVSRDGRTMVSVGSDKVAIVWDISNPRQPSRPLYFFREHVTEVNSVAISQSGEWVATGDDAGQIWVWNLATGEPLGKLLGHTNWVTGVDFNPLGNILASSSRDGTVILWDLQEMAILSGPFAVHRDWVWDIDISDNGAQLLTAGREGTLVLWNIQTNDKLGQELNFNYFFNVPVVAMSQLQEGAVLFLTQDGLTTVNNVAGKDQWADYLSLPDEISFGVLPPVLSPSGEWVAQTQTNLILLWSEATGLRTLPGHDLLIQTLLFSPDSQYLISAGCTAPLVAQIAVLCPSVELKVWHVATGKQVGEPIVVEELESAVLSFSPDGQWLAVAGCGRPGQGLQLQTQEAMGDKGLCGAGSTVLFRVEDLAAGQLTEVRRLTEGVDGLLQTDFITAVAFSPDNQLVATGSANGSLVFWQTDTGQALTLPQNSTTGRINALLFNPDGQTLASVGNDPSLTLWSAQTYQRYAVQLVEHTAPIMALQYDETGDFLVTAGADGRLVKWKANLNQWQQLACQLTNRSLTNQEWMQYVGSGPNQASCP